MTVEPYELKGKTIKDSFMQSFGYDGNGLVIEFTDGSKVVIYNNYFDCEFTGDKVPSPEIFISNQ